MVKILLHSVMMAVFLWPSAARASDDYAGAVHHYDYDDKAPLNIHEISTENRGGVKVQDITYSGASGPVPAYLVVPEGKGPFAAILWGHWMMDGSPYKNRKEFLDEAVILARSGALSLLIDAPMIRPDYKKQSDPEDTREDVIDLRRGLDLLAARSDVDAKRMAFVGHSFHAGTGAILAGVDKRPKAFVLMAGILDYYQMLVSDVPVFVQARQKVGVDAFRKAIDDGSWSNACQFVGHAAPAEVLLQNGSRDQFMTVKDIDHYLTCVSSPKTEKMYDADHALNSQATMDRDQWLQKQLGLRPVDTAAIAKLPQLN